MIEDLIEKYEKHGENKPIMIVGRNNKELYKILDLALYGVDICLALEPKDYYKNNYYIIDSSKMGKDIKEFSMDFVNKYRRNDFC